MDRAVFGGTEYVGVRLWLTAEDHRLLEQFWPDPDEQQKACEAGIKAEIERERTHRDKRERLDELHEQEHYLRMHTDDLPRKKEVTDG